MVAYGLVLFASNSVLRGHPELPKWSASLIGLTPMIPLVFVLRASVASFRALDEMERRIQSEGLMISVAATAVIALSYGFLQSAIDAPAISWLWVWPVQAATWMAGKYVAQRRYR